MSENTCVLTTSTLVWRTRGHTALKRVSKTHKTSVVHLTTLVLLDGPFSFSSLSSVSPRRRRSSALTLRSRWDTCQKATLPHRAKSWARQTQLTGGRAHSKHTNQELEEKEENLLSGGWWHLGGTHLAPPTRWAPAIHLPLGPRPCWCHCLLQSDRVRAERCAEAAWSTAGPGTRPESRWGARPVP